MSKFLSTYKIWVSGSNSKLHQINMKFEIPIKIIENLYNLSVEIHVMLWYLNNFRCLHTITKRGLNISCNLKQE